MNIILFGPPGVGKSTLIGILKSLGQRAIDLEDVYPSKIRFSLPNMLTNTVIGAADLNPRRKYNNAIKVLLCANQDVYDKRRALRDRARPGKANQAHHSMQDWLITDYDYIVDSSNSNPDQTASKILAIMRKEKCLWR